MRDVFLVKITEKVGFLRVGKQPDRIYLYDQYIRLLGKGTAPLPR